MSLQVENLAVYYQTLKGDVSTLEGATFTLTDGEIMGLAGESGCGKTTLDKSLILLTPPMKYVEGSVKLDGETLPIWDTENMNPFRFKKVSIILQYAMSALNPTQKIGKMISGLLKSRGVSYEATQPELERRLDLVELSHDALNMYPIELSGGMKQRMVMVLSTLLNPSLLIADEITSALMRTQADFLLWAATWVKKRNFCKSILRSSNYVKQTDNHWSSPAQYAVGRKTGRLSGCDVALGAQPDYSARFNPQF